MARILLAEDEGLIAMHLEMMLVGAGYEVCGVAATAQKAMDLAEMSRPDLVLMDGHLAESSSGLMATTAIVRRWRTPVIVVSGNVHEAEALAAGATLFLSKPVLGAKLLRAVEEVLAAVAGSDGAPRGTMGKDRDAPA